MKHALMLLYLLVNSTPLFCMELDLELQTEKF